MATVKKGGVKGKAEAAESEFRFRTTAELKVPGTLIDQIVGQEEAVQVVKKAAKQRRHVLLIGSPGTGKSMMGMAMAELLPREKLVSIMAFSNPNDENQPLIRVVPAHQGKDIVTFARLEAGKMSKHVNLIMIILLAASLIMPWWAYNHYLPINPILGGIMFMTFSMFGFASMVSFILFLNLGRRMRGVINVPKVVVNNFDQKKAPFYDATGAHAGALLGDVLHDPFQCFFATNKLRIKSGNAVAEAEIGQCLNALFERHKTRVQNRGQYQAIHLPRNELFVFGEANGFVLPVEVLSLNRHYYDGPMIKLATSENQEFIVTPEHKIALWRNGKIGYVEAQDVKESDEVVSDAKDIIIDEKDVINTYDAHQQEQCCLYYQYQEIKTKNQAWGYKRIAKAMGQNTGKTRWWHSDTHIPVPIQTANWLKERGLLPLKINNPKLPLIAKVLGATFGDGGVFENLNGIFLSSSEKEAVEEFGKDLEEIFNLNNGENSRIIEGGEYGRSWCYQNTNGNVIRFFLAAGAPKGNKTNIELKVPMWIKLNDELENNYYGAFFGGELGSPAQHIKKNRLTTLEVGITGKTGLENNRLEFLKEVSDYLSRKGVLTTSVYKGKVKGNLNNAIYRLNISTLFDNVLKFMIEIKLQYCKYKVERLYKALGLWADWKKKKYYALIEKGFGAEAVMNKLNLTPRSLYLLLNHFGPKEAAAEAAVA